MIPPICWWCKHFNVHQFEKEHKTTCTAFPSDIPEEIWINDFIHKLPYQDDKGIQFEMRENDNELPKALKLILKRSPMSSDEMLNWLISFLEEAEQRRQEINPPLTNADNTEGEQS